MLVSRTRADRSLAGWQGSAGTTAAIFTPSLARQVEIQEKRRRATFGPRLSKEGVSVVSRESETYFFDCIISEPKRYIFSLYANHYTFLELTSRGPILFSQNLNSVEPTNLPSYFALPLSCSNEKEELGFVRCVAANSKLSTFYLVTVGDKWSAGYYSNWVNVQKNFKPETSLARSFIIATSDADFLQNLTRLKEGGIRISFYYPDWNRNALILKEENNDILGFKFTIADIGSQKIIISTITIANANPTCYRVRIFMGDAIVYCEDYKIRHEVDAAHQRLVSGIKDGGMQFLDSLML